jgi:hypothetical protein
MCQWFGMTQRLARHGGKVLHLADCEIGFARLWLRMRRYSQSRQSLAAARQMVQRMGYHRRDRDLRELDRALPLQTQPTKLNAEAQPPDACPSPPPAPAETAGDPDVSG